jgi:hypothetical protein
LYRRFEQDLTDKRIEEAVFKIKSEDGTGPSLYFMNSEYRIESFYPGRPITIWEMRNQNIYTKFAEIICEYNFSENVVEAIKEFNPINPRNLFIHNILSNWGPQLLNNGDLMRKALEESGRKENL